MTSDFRVGPWLVKPSLNVISSNGTTVRLEPKVMEVLVCLAGHAGEALPKETLLQTVWTDTFVSEDVLKRCISELRRVFEDDAREPRIIETIPKRGYRLLAPVEAVNGNKEISAAINREPAGSRVVSRRRWRAATVAIAATALFAILLIVFRGNRSARANAVPPIRSLAVLPLQNLSTDPAQEYFSDGMTDALITDLAQVSSLKVISRTSSMQYKQTKKSLPEIARELNVDAIVEGTIQRSGDQVRITAQLIQASSDRHLWANSYQRHVQDLFALEQDVAADISNQVQAHVAPHNGPEPTKARQVKLVAVEEYLQGNYHLNRAGNGAAQDPELREAANHFERAIAAEPEFVASYIGLSQSHDNILWPSDDDFSSMTRAAERAVELDPNSSDARAQLAVTEFEGWNWREAEAGARKAIELNPNNAAAHKALADVLESTSRFDEGWNEYQRAQELDPNQDHLSWPLYLRGDYDHSIELAQKVAETHPDDPVSPWFLSQDYAQKGMYKEWATEMARVFVLMGLPDTADRFRAAFASSGRTGALRQSAKELEQLITRKQAYFPGVLAQIYASLGDKDRAFYWLTQGIEHHHMAIADPTLCEALVDPGFAPLRDDPRYAALIRRMGLPP